VFAVLLLFPTVGSFGFWDPWELNIGERAREMMRRGALLDTTAGGRYTAEPPLDLFLAALGMKIFGARELGARVLGALAGAGALLAVYWAGVGLLRPRAALLATVALGSMPLFFLGARQLTSDTSLIFGLALALGGLGRYAWPAGGKRRLRDLLAGAAGCLVGTLGGGALLGLALPCLAVTGALLVGASRRASDDDESPLTSPGVGADVPAGVPLGAGLFAKGVRGKGLVLLIALVGVGALVLTLTTANIAGRYSLLLGGVPRGGTPPQKFEYLVRQIGFGIFPWSALVVFALGRALVRLGGDGNGSAGRLGFVQLYLLLFAAFGFALTSVFVLMTGDARFSVLAPLALAIGAFLDEALEGRRAEPVLGLLAATGTMVVARDFFLAPEELASVHVLAKVKWPPTLQLGYGFLAVGAVVGAGTYLGLATRGRALGRVPARDLGEAKPWRRTLERVIVEAGRWGVQAAVAGAIVFALLVVHGLVPVLSRHFSFKPVLESYTRFAKEGEEIGRYRVEGHGAAFYSAREMTELATQERVVEFLGKPGRSFALVASEELAALDAALKLARVEYVVLDASSSRFLLLSNRPEPGEEDRNPLKRLVWLAPRPPVPRAQSSGAGEAGFDWHNQQPPWDPPRVPAYAEFGRSIELLGADYPPSVRRPTKIPLKLHFRVHTRPPAGYKVFVHFDAPGEPRILGDHDPLNGTFPTAHWLPGEYIKDYVDVDVPLMTTPAGVYTLLMGFWPGGEQKRLPITGGNINDGSDRARIGTIEIR
jgi:hypothetical protein